ncbi:unnamed protein product [Closterium sp. Yama58-4]|nr:unnamed protein product [Closterium sp. Yama58-4]
MGSQASSPCSKAMVPETESSVSESFEAPQKVPEGPVSGSAAECVQKPQQAQGVNSSEHSSELHLVLGCGFHNSKSPVWQAFPDPSGARYNPPAATLPLPFELYGQPFYRGFQWEKKPARVGSMANATLPWTLGGPRETCPAELHCLIWVHRYFGDCVCNFRDGVSFTLGMMSVVAWGVAEIPQIVTNFFAGSTEGVSLAFLMTWTVGDVFNLAGCYLEPATLPTQYYMALMYTITTIVLVAQTVYYEVLMPHKEVVEDEDEQEDGGTAVQDSVSVSTTAVTLQTPLLQGQQQQQAPSSPVGVPQGVPIPVGPRSGILSVPLSRKSSHRDIHIHSARSLVSCHTPTMGSFVPGSYGHHPHGSHGGGHHPHSLHARHAQHHVGSLLSQSPGQGVPHISLPTNSPVTRAVAFGMLLVGCLRIGTLSHSLFSASNPNHLAPIPDHSTPTFSSTSALSSPFPSLSASSSADPGLESHHLPAQVFPMRRRLLQASTRGLFSQHLLTDGDDEEPSALGELLGWLMAAIYMGGRIPQIYLNIQRGTVEGLSPLMFLFALVGNATYVGSILARSMEWRHIKPNMPWLVDAAVCVLLDLFILCQFAYYSYKNSKEESTDDDYEEVK